MRVGKKNSQQFGDGGETREVYFKRRLRGKGSRRALKKKRKIERSFENATGKKT